MGSTGDVTQFGSCSGAHYCFDVDFKINLIFISDLVNLFEGDSIKFGLLIP